MGGGERQQYDRHSAISGGVVVIDMRPVGCKTKSSLLMHAAYGKICGVVRGGDCLPFPAQVITHSLGTDSSCPPAGDIDPFLVVSSIVFR